MKTKSPLLPGLPDRDTQSPSHRPRSRYSRLHRPQPGRGACPPPCPPPRSSEALYPRGSARPLRLRTEGRAAREGLRGKGCAGRSDVRVGVLGPIGAGTQPRTAPLIHPSKPMVDWGVENPCIWRHWWG